MRLLHRHLTLPLLAILLLTGCRSVPFNSDPKCGSCAEILNENAAPEPLCPPPLMDVDPPAPVPESRFPYRNLVLEGGGVKGAAYAGAFEELSRRGILDRIDKVAGTSAGALTALMIGLGYTADEILDIVIKLDFLQFKDGSLLGAPKRLIRRYGIYKGDAALCFLRCLVGRKLCHEKGQTPPCSGRATFADLYAKRGEPAPGGGKFRELRIVGTDVTGRRSRVLSHKSTPSAELADAARISMSIPLFFAAREFGEDNDVFVDGGVLDNYPIGIFDPTVVNDEGLAEPRALFSVGTEEGLESKQTLGLHLGGAPISKRINDFFEFVPALIETVLDQQLDRLCHQSDQQRNLARTVFINPCGIRTTQFNITTAEKCELIRSGRRAVAEFLNQGPLQSCPEWTQTQQGCEP